MAETGDKEAAVVPAPEQGLSMFRKLFLLGAVVGVVGLFLKTRKPQAVAGSWKEKSMA